MSIEAVATAAPKKSWRRKLYLGARFIANYGAARLTAFIAPLALVRVMAETDYGALEFALSAGLLAATLLQLGAPTAMTRHHIVDGQERPGLALAAAALLGALGGFAAAWWGWTSQAPAHWLLAALAAPLFSAQLSLSAFCRMTGRRDPAPWVDNLGLLSLSVLAAALWGVWAPPTTEMLIWVALGLSALSGLGALVVLARLRRWAELKAIGQAFRHGPPLLAMALVGALFMSGQRTVAGLLLPLDALADYGLASRVCMVIAVAYQVVSIGFYRQIFAMQAHHYDRFFAAFLLLLTGIAVGLLFAFQRWGALIFPHNLPLPPGLFGWAGGQILAIMALGMGQMLATRHDTAARATLSGLGVGLLAVAVGAGLWALERLTPTSLTALFTLATMASAAGHFWTLRRRDLSAPWLMGSLALALVPPLVEALAF